MSSRVGNAEVFGQVLQGASHAVERQDLGSSLVDSLCLPCRPTAIARLVVAIVVDSVERVLWRWSEPHVGMEIHERINPLLTDGDASSFVKHMDRTTPDHIGPNAIFRRMSHTVRGFCLQHLSFDAAARVRAVKVVDLNQFLNATIASAQAFRMPWIAVVVEILKDCQATMFRSDWQFWHRPILPYFCVVRGTSPAEFVANRAGA